MHSFLGEFLQQILLNLLARVCCVEKLSDKTFHTHEQKENYKSSNWPVHQLITVTQLHKIEMKPTAPVTYINQLYYFGTFFQTGKNSRTGKDYKDDSVY